LTLRQRLIRFLENPVLELSNNLAENAIRPVVLAYDQGTRAPINILEAEFDNLRTSQPQIRHQPKNGEIPLSRGAVTIHAS